MQNLEWEALLASVRRTGATLPTLAGFQGDVPPRLALACEVVSLRLEGRAAGSHQLTLGLSRRESPMWALGLE